MKDKISGVFKPFFEKLKSKNKLQYLFIGIIVLILVFVFSFNFDLSANKTSASNDLIESYVDNLEKKLSKTLSKVEGAGEVSVVITVESGMETVLAMKTVKTETSSGLEIGFSSHWP